MGEADSMLDEYNEPFYDLSFQTEFRKYFKRQLHNSIYVDVWSAHLGGLQCYSVGAGYCREVFDCLA